jgi:DNA polymerase III sliding clamp (beta) subunit (PCNA family)
MKFSVEQSLLADLLDKAHKFTRKKIGQLLFDHFVLRVEGDRLTVRASSGVCTFAGSVSVERQEAGEVTVEAMPLIKLVNALGSTLTIQSTGEGIQLSNTQSSYGLAATEGQVLPSSPPEDYTARIELTFREFQAIIANSTKFVDKTDPILSGIWLKLGQTAIDVGATNKHILLHRRVEHKITNCPERELVLPGLALDAIARLSVGAESVVTLSLGENSLRVSGLLHESVLDIQILRESYPNLLQIVSKPSLTFEVKRKPLLVLLSRLVLTLEFVGLKIVDDELVLTGVNHKTGGSGVEVLEVEKSSGNPLSETVYLNLAYFKDIVSSFDETTITLGFVSPNRPFLISSGHQRTVIMPIQNLDRGSVASNSTESYPEPVAA